MNLLNNWGPIVLIILAYAFGVYLQNRQLDIFKEGLYKYLDAKFKAIEDRLSSIESQKLLK